MEAFTTKGHWWLPGNRPDDAIAGILTFDPHGQSELELFGTFLMQTRNEPIILGVGDKGQAITLVHCLDLSTGSSSSDFVWEYSRYLPSVILQNQHFEREEEVICEHLWIKYYGLEEWASTGKSWGAISADELFHRRSDEDTAKVTLDGFEFSVWRDHSRSGDQLNTVLVQRDAAIRLVPDSPWGIDETFAKIFQIRVFLSLAMGTPTWPVSVEASNSSSSLRGFTFHFNPRTEFSESNRLNSHFMHFTLESQLSAIELILRNWFTNYNRLEKVLNLYNQDISSKLVLEEKFLTYAKAVEAYHRQMHKETYVDQTKFVGIKEDLKKTIKSCIPADEYKELRRRIYESMNLANSPSLHDRLADLQEKHQDHNRQLFEEFDTFADAVVSTRDQLTHHFDSDKSKARLDGSSLYYMSKRLRYILELCLLSKLGFDDEVLQEMVTNYLKQSPLPPRPESFRSDS